MNMHKPIRARARALHIVGVDDIRIEAFIGIHAHEKERRQSLIVSAELTIDAPCGDSIADTIDYNQVVEACRALADDGIALIETFATRLCEDMLKDDRVSRVSVRVTKPGALPNGTAWAETTLSR
jgi:dihydroneopterin aldolase